MAGAQADLVSAMMGGGAKMQFGSPNTMALYARKCAVVKARMSASLATVYCERAKQSTRAWSDSRWMREHAQAGRAGAL